MRCDVMTASMVRLRAKVAPRRPGALGIRWGAGSHSYHTAAPGKVRERGNRRTPPCSALQHGCPGGLLRPDAPPPRSAPTRCTGKPACSAPETGGNPDESRSSPPGRGASPISRSDDAPDAPIRPPSPKRGGCPVEDRGAAHSGTQSGPALRGSEQHAGAAREAARVTPVERYRPCT